jgi:hypothetical protein
MSSRTMLSIATADGHNHICDRPMSQMICLVFAARVKQADDAVLNSENKSLTNSNRAFPLQSIEAPPEE